MVSMVLLVGFLSFGPQISSAVGGLLSKQFTKDLTPSTACGDTSAQQSPQAAGQEEKDGKARKKSTDKPQKQAAGERAVAETETTKSNAATPGC